MSMFKKGDISSKDGGETVIAHGVRVEGDFTSHGFVLVDGEMIGSLKTEANLEVGERARISANVTAANARVAGEVRGNLKIKDKLELAKTARVIGDLAAKVLSVEAGAVISGRCLMGEETAKNGAVKEKKQEFANLKPEV